MDQYLQATDFFDYKNPRVRTYGRSLVDQSASAPREIAIALYNGVRDDIRYNAYTFDTKPSSFSASYCLDKGESYCIPKAILLAALCRSYNIPARIGLADVKNHLASPQFLEYLRRDVFVLSNSCFPTNEATHTSKEILKRVYVMWLEIGGSSHGTHGTRCQNSVTCDWNKNSSGFVLFICVGTQLVLVEVFL